jgi:hypothetical protein
MQSAGSLFNSVIHTEDLCIVDESMWTCSAGVNLTSQKEQHLTSQSSLTDQKRRSVQLLG